MDSACFEVILQMEQMDDTTITSIPTHLESIWKDTLDAGFSMPSDHQTGSLLRTLAASRPNAKLLELGTGTGLSAAWILDGMDANSTLDSVDTDPAVVAIARRHLGYDQRLKLHVQDGAQFLANCAATFYDYIFADAWPGKYSDLELALGSLKIGGVYIIDDMLPQSNWPDGHGESVIALCDTLDSRPDLQITKLNWSTGLIIATKTA